jgi:hypothetical protein
MMTPGIRSGWASMQAFRRIRAATRGLIAAPWTPLAFLCSGVEEAGRRGQHSVELPFSVSFSLAKESCA